MSGFWVRRWMRTCAVLCCAGTVMVCVAMMWRRREMVKGHVSRAAVEVVENLQ